LIVEGESAVFASSSFGPEVIGPLGSILGIGIVVIAVVAINQWRKVRIAEIEATLKQQMLDRGMTSEEIVRVLEASRNSSTNV